MEQQDAATAEEQPEATESGADDATEENNDAENEGAEEESGPVEIDAEELKALQEKAAKADEHWDRILRMTAESENFKKRAARDRQEAIRYANEGLIESLLPVLDSFNMAMSAANSTAETDLKSLKMGVEMILTQLNTVLKEAGVEELDAAGKQFDPTWQEAMSQQETTDVPEGQVIQQLRRGYKLKDRLVRAASVVVAKAPAPEAPPQKEEQESAENEDQSE